MDAPPPARSPRVLAVAWVAAWCALAAFVAVITSEWEAFYASAGVVLPVVTGKVLEVGDDLRTGPALAPLAACLAVGLAPLWLARDAPMLRRWLGSGIIQATLTALLVQ